VEKGLDTLLAAWEELDAKLPLKIVGDGPLADLVVAATQQFSNVEWLGRRPMDEVHALMGDALCLVFPSKWYETFGRVAIEAFAKGTPVVASKIGAIAELVKPGQTGLHFQPGNPIDLACAVKDLQANPSLLKTMRQKARSEFEKKYTPRRNYEQLIQVYQQIRSEYAPLVDTMTSGRS
jgi:glycosyltransferase involved in cell wall biosynthesis